MAKPFTDVYEDVSSDAGVEQTVLENLKVTMYKIKKGFEYQMTCMLSSLRYRTFLRIFGTLLDDKLTLHVTPNTIIMEYEPKAQTLYKMDVGRCVATFDNILVHAGEQKLPVKLNVDDGGRHVRFKVIFEKPQNVLVNEASEHFYSIIKPHIQSKLAIVS